MQFCLWFPLIFNAPTGILVQSAISSEKKSGWTNCSEAKKTATSIFCFRAAIIDVSGGDCVLLHASAQSRSRMTQRKHTINHQMEHLWSETQQWRSAVSNVAYQFANVWTLCLIIGFQELNMGESVVGKLPPNASRILSGDKAQLLLVL